MLSGLAAVLLLLEHSHPHKTLFVTGLVLLGGIADFFDGFLARRWGVSSEMGKQLDSFADLVTFGIAPVALVNYITQCGHSLLVIFASLLYVAAGAFRLARYNLSDFSKHFMGLPITIAGVVLTMFSAAFFHLTPSAQPPAYTGIAMTAALVLLSIMMVSKRKIPRILG